MSGFPQHNNNPNQNIPRRAQPFGCSANNNIAVNTGNVPTQYGNIQNGPQNPQAYNNVQQTYNNVQQPYNNVQQPYNNVQQPAGMNCMPGQSIYPNQNTQNFPTAPQQPFQQTGINCIPVHQSLPNQNTQTCPLGAQQPIYPAQSLHPNYNRQSTLCTPCTPNIANNNSNPFVGTAQPYVYPNVGPYMNTPEAYNNMQPMATAPVYTSPAHTLPLWNVQNPWPQIRTGQTIQQPAFSSSFIFPQDTFHPNKIVTNLQITSHAPSPKPLGKLLFPTLFDFTHDSFFKMLIHMSGFEAKNINISANRNSLELRAVKEEIEKQVNDFSGYILKQVARMYHFPEPIEESKIQISISEDVICILIPWKQNT